MQCSAENRHHAEEVRRTAATTAAATAVITTTATPTAAARGTRFIFRSFIARDHPGGEDLGQQRLVLHGIEIAGLRIAAGGLPAGNHGAGRLVELSGRLGVEAEAREAALHVAALRLG